MRTFAAEIHPEAWSTFIAGCSDDDRALVVHAYETWGFAGLSNELIDILNIWANFIYGPMLEDRVRTIAEESKTGSMGGARPSRCIGLRDKGPVKVPREFVFMDRAAIGLGGVFLHLDAELNFHRLFDDTIAGVRSRRRGAAAEGRPARSRLGVTSLPEASVSSAAPDCPRHCLYGIGKRNKGLKQHQGERNAYRPRPNAIRRWTTQSIRRPTDCFIKLALCTIVGVAVLMALMAVFVV